MGSVVFQLKNMVAAKKNQIEKESKLSSDSNKNSRESQFSFRGSIKNNIEAKTPTGKISKNSQAKSQK